MSNFEGGIGHSTLRIQYSCLVDLCYVLTTMRNCPSNQSDPRNLLLPAASLLLFLLGASPTLAAFTIFQSGFANRGSSWVDYNNNGWLDLHDGTTLWRNNNGANFTSAGVLGSGNSFWGDIDNDGFIDIYGGVGYLMRNNGGTGIFLERPFPTLPMGESQAASWADHDGDAFIDLYVGGNQGSTDAFVSNNQGTSFTKGVEFAGRYARGITSCDFDKDGDIDVYVSHYWQAPNLLWVNNGTGVFLEQGATYGVAGDPNVGSGYAHTIGSAWGDLDNDGHIDLFVGNFNHHDSRISEDSKFLRNLGPGGSYRFEDKSSSAGLAWQESFASPALGDYDNDGDLDLFLTTVYNHNHPVLYRNNGNWTFSDVTAEEGLSGLSDTYQAAWGDFDNDGDLDLVTYGRIYQNTSSGNHWLKVSLEGNGTTVNRSAIGAQVRVQVGTQILTRQVESGTGEGNTSEMTLHFGLGSWTTPVNVEIFWPDGTTQNIYNVDVDQQISQDSPSGQPPPPARPIGDPSPANNWDTTSAVSVRWGREKSNRPWISVIDGSGIDSTGQYHTDCLEADCVMDASMPATMGFAGNGVTPARGGTVAGSQWLEFAFDDIYQVTDMLLWNYNEDAGGSAPNPNPNVNWTMQGMKKVTIQYTTVGNGSGWGSNNSGDWTTLSGGSMVLARATGSNLQTAQTIPIDDSARYFVITSANAPEANFMNDFSVSSTSTEAALSEVRFMALANVEITRTEVRGDTFFRFQSEAGKTYRLERATTMSPPDWTATGCVVDGDGTQMDAFDPAGYSASNFYRIMEK